MTARLVPLGTNSLIPSFGRQTLSFLCATEKSLVLLVEPTCRDFVADYTALSIILSNYSYDRLVGIASLSELWRGPVTIYAPGPPLIDRDPQPILDQVLRLALGTKSKAPEEHLRVVVISEPSLTLEDLDINFLSQKAPDGSIGIRLGDFVAYLPDSDADASVFSFIEGCKILLHGIPLRCLDYSKGISGLKLNPLLRQVIELAVKAQNKLLIPINLRPELTADDVSRIAGALDSPGLIGMSPLEGTILRI
jgi:hypothetical protein